jgi:hypothetical protein
MVRARFLGRRTALISLFLANCLLMGMLIAISKLSLPGPLIAALGATFTGAQLSLWLVWAGKPTTAVSGAIRLAELGGRSDAARQSAIRIEDTELFRRWYLEFRLKQEAERCSAFSISMAVVVVRLGSTDLAAWSGNFWTEQSAAATQHLLKFVRGTDICAPLGPLEFAILLVQCDRDGGERAADRIAGQLRAQTCSIGVAAFPEDKCEALALIELARGRAEPRGAVPESESRHQLSMS